MRNTYFVFLLWALVSMAQGQLYSNEEYERGSDCFWEMLRSQNSQFVAKSPFYLPETIPYLPTYLSSGNFLHPYKQSYSLCPNFYDYLTRLDPQLKPYIYLPQANLSLFRKRIEDSLIFFYPSSPKKEREKDRERLIYIVGGDNLGNSLQKGIKALYVGTENYINKVPQAFREKALFSYPCHSLLKGPEVRISTGGERYSATIYCVYLYIYDTEETQIDCLDYIEKLEREESFGEKHSILKLIFKMGKYGDVSTSEYLGQILVSGNVLKRFDNLGRPFHHIFQF